MKRYPKYKESGVEWLGEVPEHWTIDRFKRSTKGCRNGIWGDEPKQDENDIPCVRVADFDRESLQVTLDEPTIRNVTASERIGRVLEKNDLLLEKSGGGEGQPVGCVVLYADPKPAVCSNFVARVQIASGMNPSYWRYSHAAAYAVRLNTRSIKQTSGIQNLDQSQYLDERAAFPSLPEQTAIAAFLDRETGKIDALVSEQWRLIELLKEKRQAVISHAVTRGLNPNRAMRQSGVEWFAETPTHWEVGSLQHFWEVVDCKHVTVPFLDEGFAIASVLEVREFELNLSTAERTSEEFYNLLIGGSRKPERGDVIYCRNTANTGTSAYIDTDEPIALGQDVSLIKSKTQNGRFLNYVLHSGWMADQLTSVMVGSTFKRVNVSEIKSFKIACPPRMEQDDIAGYLDSEMGKLATLTAAAERAIELLQERRTALISAAVTGKIDVRGISDG